MTVPNLGKYADAVLGAYSVSIALILALVALSLWRSAKVRAALREVEERQGKKHG